MDSRIGTINRTTNNDEPRDDRYYQYGGSQRLMDADVGQMVGTNMDNISEMHASSAWGLDHLGNWVSQELAGVSTALDPPSYSKERTFNAFNEIQAKGLSSTFPSPPVTFTHDAAGQRRLRDGGVDDRERFTPRNKGDARGRLVKREVWDDAAASGSGAYDTISTYEYNALGHRVIERWVNEPKPATIDTPSRQRELSYNPSWQIIEERMIIDKDADGDFEPGAQGARPHAPYARSLSSSGAIGHASRVSPFTVVPP